MEQATLSDTAGHTHLKEMLTKQTERSRFLPSFCITRSQAMLHELLRCRINFLQHGFSNRASAESAS
jgi:hypothetical protein